LSQTRAIVTTIPSPHELRDTILGIFEQVRQTPKAPYDPERLLAFLTDPPPGSGRRVADTFAGRRRFVRFMHRVQLELGICFTLDEWERGFDLDDAVELAAVKMAKPSQGLRLARQRLERARARLVLDPLKFGLLTSPFLMGPAFAPFWPLRLALALMWAAITGTVAAAVIMEVRYTRRLVARIESVALR
jgi:hypothetical protein